MIVQTARFAKNKLLPRGRQYRRLPFGPASGCVMSIDFATDVRFYMGVYERELIPYFKRLVRPSYRCFDVGCLNGYDALMAAKLSGGPVVAFDCDPAVVPGLRETFALNPSYSIELIEAYVGNKVSDGYTTLDEAASRTFVPDFIKIDIEGAEAIALEGASTILSQRKPSLIIETHDQKYDDDCMKILKGHGYTPEVVEQGWLHEPRPLVFNRWLVCEGRTP